MNKRIVLANFLDRSGATDVMLALRRHTPSPWLPILTFHRVRDISSAAYPFDSGVIDSTVADFDRQMSMIREYNTPVGIDDVVRFVDGGSLPVNPVLITFDDGYRDNHDIVLPILRRHNVKAVFFVATSYLSERRMFWWDRINYLVKQSSRSSVSLAYPFEVTFDIRSDPDRAIAIARLLRLVKNHHGLDLAMFLKQLAQAVSVPWDDALDRRLADDCLMTWDQVRALRAAGMDVESHTRTHRVLQTLPDDEILDELRGSRAELEAQLGEPVRAISYPVGQTIVEHAYVRAALIQSGYEIGFTNCTGVQSMWRKSDRFDLRRIGVDCHMPDALFRATLAMPTIFA